MSWSSGVSGKGRYRLHFSAGLGIDYVTIMIAIRSDRNINILSQAQLSFVVTF